MSQAELKAFFDWCAQHIAGFKNHDCDESEHYYIDDVLVGGWAGDRCEFFFEHSDVLARTLRMKDAFDAK